MADQRPMIMIDEIATVLTVGSPFEASTVRTIFDALTGGASLVTTSAR